MLESYFTLRSRIERLTDSIRARYKDQIVCQAGCSECCQAGLTAVLVEAVAIGTALGVSEDRVILQAGQTPLEPEGRCVQLDDEDLCTIYANRPILCRTHGYPLKYASQEGFSICEKNFIDRVPHSSVILDMTNLETALFAVNVDYCRRNGFNPLARVAIDRLVALKE